MDVMGLRLLPFPFPFPVSSVTARSKVSNMSSLDSAFWYSLLLFDLSSESFCSFITDSGCLQELSSVNRLSLGLGRRGGRASLFSSGVFSSFCIEY